MADTKISNLPAATALAETDLVPVVQSGTNAKATINQFAPALIEYAEATLNPLGQALSAMPDGAVYAFRKINGVITPVALTDAPAPTPDPGEAPAPPPPPPPSAPPPASPSSSAVRYNHCLQSESLSTSPWLNIDSHFTIASRTSPPTGVTAWQTITVNNATSFGLTQQFDDLPAGNVCFSLIAEDDVADWICVRAQNSGFTKGFNAWFNVDTGTLGTTSHSGALTGWTASLSTHQTGKFVCAITGPADAVGWRLEVFPTDGDNSMDAPVGHSLGVGGVQAEEGTVRTRYKPTTTTKASRTLTTINDSIDDASLTAGETATATFELLDDQGAPWDQFSQLSPGSDNKPVAMVPTTAPATNASGITTVTVTAQSAGTANIYGMVGSLRSGGEAVTVTAAPSPAPSPTPAPSPVPPGSNEAQVFMSSSRNLASETPGFFGVSAWEVPWNSNKVGPLAGSYSVNRYCQWTGNANTCTELTNLANGTGSYANFRTWVDYHKARNADVMVQVWMNSHGSATTLTTNQWNNVKAKFQEFLTQAAGDVKYVLLANEPIFAGAPGENPNEPTSGGWPSRSATLYAEYARVIKQIILQSAWPTIKVIGPELMSLENFRRSQGLYAMEASAAGYNAGLGTGSGTKMKDFIDIFSFHGYCGYPSFTPANGGYNLIVSLKSELAAIGFTGPIWQTEFMRTPGGSELYNSPWSQIVEQIARRHAAEVSTGVGHSTNFEWGSYGPNSYFDENSAQGQRARTWWAAYVNWWTGAPIGRIAQLTDSRIRVTRTDGATLTIPTNLTDGTLAPNP